MDVASNSSAVAEGNCEASQKVLAAMQADPMFASAYIDTDEWRTEPVRHRYIHGGFNNTDTRFSFYLPPVEQYAGRFFQYITPVPLSETISQGATGEEDKIGFALDSGAYFIETNGGGKNQTGRPEARVDPTIAGFRANAAAAHYSRIVAMEMYGCQRPFGYAFGGSGGAYRTIGSIENTEGVWDGVVPYVPGSPMAAPNVFTVRMYALRVLKDKLPAIADALDVGSNIDPYQNLTDEEAKALAEVTRMGFPLSTWYMHDKLDLHGFASLFAGVVAVDPAYFTEDFWHKPGYEGVNPPQSLTAAIIEHSAKVTAVVMQSDLETSGLKQLLQAGASQGLADDAFKALLSSGSPDMPVALQLSSVPELAILGADIVLTSGAAKGQKLLAAKNLQGNFLLISGNSNPLLSEIKVGDELEINNRNVLASQTYHRHQVPAEGYPVYDIFRGEKGLPIYPQRPMLLGPMFTAAAGGSVPTMAFKGKMIMLSNLHDTEAYPWQGDWYLQQAKANLGETFNDQFRLWYTDHASHGDQGKQRVPTQLVSYLGVLQQALRDVSAWVEQGIEPAPNTRYQIDGGQVHVPAQADERGGIQPVIQLLANGQKRAEVAVGEEVKLSAAIAVPSATGKIVSVAWDFEGKGEFGESSQFAPAMEAQTVAAVHRYSAPGTYFVTLRATSHRTGDAQTPFARIHNLDRVRVVVK